MKRNHTLASALTLVLSLLLLMSSGVPVFAHLPETDTLCGFLPLPSATSGVNVILRDGDARSFADPPDVIAYANTQHSSPPSEFTIVTSGTIWRYNQWIALVDKGNSVRASTTVDVTSLGVQFWGDITDGWARVLVDGSEVWRGNTYGTDTKYPGGAFVKYLEISGLALGKHTISVENIGINGSGGHDDVTIFFFGLRKATPSPLPVADGTSIDVWTNKGGQGSVASGGTFQVGEITTIYVRATVTVQTNWTMSGPSVTKSGSQLLQKGEAYQLPLGQAEKSDIGQWQVAFQGEVAGQSAYDKVSFNVVAPGTAPASTPSVSTPPAGVGEGAARIDAASATELDALIALKMAEGELAADLYMDADGDGQVTREDASLIMGWAAGLPGTLPPQTVGEDQTTFSITPSAILPSDADSQTLVGKWKMTRLLVPSAVPEEIPGWIVDLVIPKEATWEISRDGEQLKIKYDGRDTWYHKAILGGIYIEQTATRGGQGGVSCSFKTDCTFSYDSLPLGIGLILRNIKQIRGSFTDEVSLKISGASLAATITIDNVDGTYYEKGSAGQMKQKAIDFDEAKIKYRGYKKE
ncbi:MAG: hypothetical protein JXB43_00110 [Dehalococcoidia bacterium]|nr:hypothetical protein [Dehalococcoidia bacterium]